MKMFVKIWKKSAMLMIAASMAVGQVPITVSATDKVEEETQIVDNTNIISNGECGDNLTWEIDSDYTLTILGEGAMDDGWGISPSPWAEYQYDIKKLVIKEGVTSIGNNALSDCYMLTDIEIADSVKTIGDNAFRGCMSLEKVDLSLELKTIGNSAFERTALTEIDLPETLETIGDNAFYESNLQSVHIPASVTSIGKAAFGHMYLNEVTVANDNPNYVVVDGVLYTKDMSRLMLYPTYKEDTSYEIPAGVTTIDSEAFFTFPYLDNLIMPESLQKIERYAFRVVSGEGSSFKKEIPNLTFKGDFLKLQEEATPDGWNDIFYIPQDGSYIEMTICYPNENKTWNKEVMSQMATYRTHVTFVSDDGKSVIGTCGHKVIWEVIEDGILVISGTGSVSGYDSGEETPWYSLADTFDKVIFEEGITSIGSRAFEGFENLTDVEIPNTMWNIEERAFYNTGLTEVNIPASVQNIYPTAFAMSDVRAVNVDKDNEWLYSEDGVVFSYGYEESEYIMIYYPTQKEDTTYEMPGEITNIRQGAFVGNPYIRKLIFSSNLRYMESECIDNCASLTEIVFTGDMPSIEYLSSELNLTAYYPEDNTTWPEDMEPCEGIKEWIPWIPQTSFEIIKQPVNQTVEEGENAVFSVEATGEELTYQWQYSTTGKMWYESGMDGHDTSRLTVPALAKRNGQMYRCIITDMNGEQLLTDEVVLTVEEPVKLEIMKQPEDKTASKGDVVVFSVDAVGEELTYQWQYSNNEGKYWYDSGMTGCTTSELSVEVTAKRDGQMYRCVVTDGNKNTVNSGSATLRIAAKELIIVTQPESQTVSEGTTVQFVIDATGEGLTYQWQYSNNDGKYWYNSGMDGNKTNTLTVEALKKRDGQVYRCVIKDANGNKLISDTVKLSLEEVGIVIVAQPEDITASKGEEVVFTIEAQGEELIYQWQYSNNNGKYWFNSGMEGSKTNALKVEALSKRDGQMYRCVITDENGNTIISDAGTLTIK